MSVFVDFVGLNTLVSSSFVTGTYDNVLDAGLNSLEYTINPEEDLAAINLHRNGPYNFSTFKQIRIHENPLTRYQRRNNLLSFSKRPEQLEIRDSNGNILKISEKFGDLLTFDEPAVVSSYYPLVYNLGHYIGDNKLFIERFGLSFDYSNHITYFSNDELNKLLLLDDLDDEVYEEIKALYLNGALESNASDINYFEFLRYKQDIFPREINKYKYNVRQRTNYENDFWRDAREDRQITNDTFGATYYVSMWNLDPDENWSTRSSVLVGAITSNTRAPGILQNGWSHFENYAAGVISNAPTYNRRHTIPQPYTASVVAPSGIPIEETGSAAGVGEIFQGDALWQAGEQAGKNPFYSSYDNFIAEMRGIGKDFSIVPEFRISDHVQTLLKGGNLRKLPDMFEVTGGEAGSNKSNEANFYETYSTTDFLKHFAEIKEDHKDFEQPATITLTCKALKKFLAYDSFYPQDRSVDCVEQFYDSYIDYMSSNTGLTQHMQVLFDPLFAPGVLYNSIKSGIAVDYSIKEASVQSSTYSTGSSPNDFYAYSWPNFSKKIPFESLLEPEKYLSNTFLIHNEPHPSGVLNITASWDGKGDNLYTKIVSNYLAEIPEFFLQGSQLSTIVSEEQGSDNFGVAEFGKVYAMRLKIFKTMNVGNKLLERTTIGESKIGGYITPQSRAGQETITMYSRPSAFGPPCAGYISVDPDPHFDSRDGINPVFTPPYYDGEAWIDFVWKAPEAGTAGLMIGQQTGKFSLSEIINAVTASALRWDKDPLAYDKFGSITTVSNFGPLAIKWQSSPIQNLYRDTAAGRDQFDLNYYPSASSPINYNSMQLFSSVNPLQAGRIVSRDLENDTILNENIQQVIDANKGATNARWVIQTKFECPILNFKDVSLTTSSVNLHSAQTPRGIWHQHGVIPENNEGIYLQIEDLPETWITNALSSSGGDLADYIHNGNKIGSLADLCGFSTNPVKLGQVAQGRVISEAVVAVPYIEQSGVKKFFEINADNFQNAKRYFQAVDIVNKGGDPSALGLGDPEFFEKRAGSSVIDQVRKMRRYVFPPTMDFFNYSEVTPFAMYIFEFTQTLSQQDLADIWQGLPPEIGTSFDVAEDSVSHPLLANQLLGSGEGTDRSRIGEDLNTEIRWMVFKVKQRAKTNYFDKVIGKKAGYGQAATAAGFQTNAQSETAAQAKISYNWPYDFFSLVELVKIDAEVEFSNIPEGKFEPKKTKIPEGVQSFAANLSGRRRR
jgi:hypothetical protein